MYLSRKEEDEKKPTHARKKKKIQYLKYNIYTYIGHINAQSSIIIMYYIIGCFEETVLRYF